jgi:hypothetical protein
MSRIRAQRLEARGRMMIVFWLFIYLSCFSAGIMLVLQIQHFGLYPLVGKQNFAACLAANNRAAD